MASTGFIGRAAELRSVTAALDEGGRLLLFAGGAGLGKSCIAREAVALARERGFSTAWGRCRETEGAPAFWPWIQIFRGIRADLGAPAFDARVGRYVDLLATVLPDLNRSPRSSDPFRTYDAAARALVDLAAERPLFLVLDDLHAADVGSIRMLRFVAAEMESSRIAILGTFRNEDRTEALTDLVGDLVTSRAVRLSTLEGLEPSEVARLIAIVTGTEVDLAATLAVHARTNGNPFFVTELARLGLRGPAPETVREAIRARVRRLPQPTRLVLATSSVLGRDFGGDLLEAICDLRGVSLVAAFQPAAQAGLIVADTDRQGYYRFVHALVQESIYADLDDLARRAAHARAADAVEALGEPARTARLDELAFHAGAAAVDTATRRRAAALCEEAGRHAKAALAFEVAARWFERCVELDPSRRTFDLLISHASTLHGPAARRRWEEAFEEAVRTGDGEAAARAALGVGDSVVSAGVIDQALVRLLEKAETCVPSTSAVSIELEARRAIELYWQADRVPSRETAARAVGRAESSGYPRALAAALHARRFVLRGPTELEERIAIGERLATLAAGARGDDLELQAYVWMLPEHMRAGNVTAVDADLGVIEDLASRTRRPLARWYALLFRAMRAAFDGRLAEALQSRRPHRRGPHARYTQGAMGGSPRQRQAHRRGHLLHLPLRGGPSDVRVGVLRSRDVARPDRNPRLIRRAAVEPKLARRDPHLATVWRAVCGDNPRQPTNGKQGGRRPCEGAGMRRLSVRARSTPGL